MDNLSNSELPSVIIDNLPSFGSISNLNEPLTPAQSNFFGNKQQTQQQSPASHVRLRNNRNIRSRDTRINRQNSLRFEQRESKVRTALNGFNSKYMGSHQIYFEGSLTENNDINASLTENWKLITTKGCDSRFENGFNEKIIQCTNGNGDDISTLNVFKIQIQNKYTVSHKI